MTKGDDTVTGFQFNHPSSGEGWFAGITKREYFAALAFQGILASTVGSEQLAGVHVSSWATLSVEAADSLIEQLNAKESK
jgi:hypothetical protein